jgi:integrase/recombinase XerC
MLTVFYILNIDAFRDYLQGEKYSHIPSAYCNDISSFESYNTTFHQNIDQANYSQIRTWIVFLVDAGLSNVSVNRKCSFLESIL